jgi:hypothetical protein
MFPKATTAPCKPSSLLLKRCAMITEKIRLTSAVNRLLASKDKMLLRKVRMGELSDEFSDKREQP